MKFTDLVLAAAAIAVAVVPASALAHRGVRSDESRGANSGNSSKSGRYCTPRINEHCWVVDKNENDKGQGQLDKDKMNCLDWHLHDPATQTQPILLEDASALGVEAIVSVSKTISSGSRTPGEIYPDGAIYCVISGRVSLVSSEGGSEKTASIGECLDAPQGKPVVVFNQQEEEARVYLYKIISSRDGVSGPDPDYRVDVCEERKGLPSGPVYVPAGDVYQRQCTTIGTCDPDYEGSGGAEGNPPPCLQDCKINDEPVPTSTLTVNSVPLGEEGVSINQGNTIPIEPSWTVSGGHSGVLVNAPVIIDEKNFSYITEGTTRLKGTRSVTHTHDYGGVTCLAKGEMTLLLDLSPTAPSYPTAKAGECYWMPARRYMSGMNTGDETSLMYDMFFIPKGENPLTPREVFVGSDSYRAKAQQYCDDPVIASTVTDNCDCCDGLAIQNLATASINGWFCPNNQCNDAN